MTLETARRTEAVTGWVLILAVPAAVATLVLFLNGHDWIGFAVGMAVITATVAAVVYATKADNVRRREEPRLLAEQLEAEDAEEAAAYAEHLAREEAAAERDAAVLAAAGLEASAIREGDWFDVYLTDPEPYTVDVDAIQDMLEREGVALDGGLFPVPSGRRA